MVITIRSLVAGADTADQGDIVRALLITALNTGRPFVVSFDGIQNVTSSFVTSAFVRLLDSHSFDVIKRDMRIVNSTRQINSMIKQRLQRVALQEA